MLLLFVCLLFVVHPIQIPTNENEHEKLEALQMADQLSDQQLKKISTPQQVFLLEIADYLEGTSIYNFLDLQNKDNQSKRIIIATILSILLIVICCVIIQFVLDQSKKCKIKLSRENTPIPA